MQKLRVVIADDERPARNFLKNLLAEFDDVEIVGEAENGAEAVELIKQTKPDLALLDLQMPELSGLDVVRSLRKNQLPLVAFVTAYDEYAVQAFEINAVDYLLKPVEKTRLMETLQRAHERLEKIDFREIEAKKLQSAIKTYESSTNFEYLKRIPVKKRDEIFLVPVREVASIVADGELLHITTIHNRRYTINYRLKDLEARLSPERFIRISRSALINLEMIAKINSMPGGTYTVVLKNSQELPVSRLQSKILREKYLKM
ncbi:MAG: response regulator [Acidobacteria bacterium]|jgi:DNA-binding LytR/AlgR family response regulator|nr:MAG: response regulator [Acidobacteriota bacterium]GIU82796.1 MAG: DNA-binding response regulator [Pyrinomonadaceae bacterium]